MKFVVGLWSIDTPSYSFVRVDIQRRIMDLARAVEELKQEIEKAGLPRDQKIKGIFVAPEYYLARQYAATHELNVGVVERTIDVGTRDHCLEMLMTISEANPDILIVPGTMTWKKTFDRLPQEEFKRDLSTRARTHVPKTGPSRRDKLARDLQGYIDLDDDYDDLRNPDPNLTSLKFSKFRSDNNKTISMSGQERVNVYRPSNAAKVDMVSGRVATDRWRLKLSSKEDTIRTTPANIPFYMRNSAYILLDGRVIYKYHKRGDYFESVNTDTTVFVPSVKSPVHDIDVGHGQRLKFGFEICLDHGNETLRHLIRKDGLGAPDFHIVSSAHVTNDEQAMTMREGGYYLHASSADGCTGVYRNVGGQKIEVEEQKSRKIVGSSTPLRVWAISLERGGFLKDVQEALAAYGKTKTVLASRESKNAITILQGLATRRDVAGLREHIEWYVGKPNAARPVGAGEKLKAGKRLHTLLSPLVA